MRDRRIVDVLTDLLSRSRARGAAFSHTTARAPWGVSFPTDAGLAVHAVLEGEVLLLAGDHSTRLLAGDLAVVHGGVEHRLASSPGARCTELAAALAAGPLPGTSRRYELAGGDGDPAVFCCGAYLFEGDLCADLVASLPPVLHLRPRAGSELHTTAEELAREMLVDRPGQQIVLDRLLDVALVHALREHFGGDGSQPPRWFRASLDPHVGRALRAVHGDPGHPWSVGELAATAAMSRATFTRRFTSLVGAAPLKYVTEWRMALARERLHDTDEGIAAIAAAVGYASEFSFAAAFKRRHGTAPGRWRLDRRRAG